MGAAVAHNGKWGRQKNMGSSIVTAETSWRQFIHADNATLYFTSDGWSGYEVTAIFFFFAERPEQNGAFLKICYPINTIESSGGSLLLRGWRKHLYSSDRSGIAAVV